MAGPIQYNTIQYNTIQYIQYNTIYSYHSETSLQESKTARNSTNAISGFPAQDSNSKIPQSTSHNP